MKNKLLVLLMVFALIISTAIGVSAAETEGDSNTDRFEIRNGIFLGDDFESVLEKNDLGFEKEDYKEYTEDEDDGLYKLWTKSAKIAGIDDSKIQFIFKDKILEGAVYSFPNYDNKDTADSEYSKLCASLGRKYGEKLNNTNGDIDLITTNAITNAATTIALFKALEGVGDFRDYDEWKYTDLSDYNVKIDLVCYYVGTSYSEATYHNLIGYKMYTDDDYLGEVQQKREEQEEMDNDL